MVYQDKDMFVLGLDGVRVRMRNFIFFRLWSHVDCIEIADKSVKIRFFDKNSPRFSKKSPRQISVASFISPMVDTQNFHPYMQLYEIMGHVAWFATFSKRAFKKYIYQNNINNK